MTVPKPVRVLAAKLRRELVLSGLLPSPLVPSRARIAVLRALGASIAPGVYIQPGCFIGGPNLAVGAGTVINYACFLDTSADITIGARCGLGMQVMLCTASHEIGDADERVGAWAHRPIVIEDGCWLGARATVLPGTRIGAGCVIAAGAVVAGDCEPHGLYAGVPARRIKELG